ncbi:hypothetical protein REPUB_Repub18cG0149500 [Reevesia pubescens]
MDSLFFKEMGQFQLQQVLTLKPYHCKFTPLVSFSHPPFNPLPKRSTIRSFFGSSRLIEPLKFHILQSAPTIRPRLVCKMSGSGDRRKPEKPANGVFWIILLNLGIYVADHLFQVRGIQSLYLYHNWPAWYQFVTSTFCHANWKHLSSNLFFLYIFGKLVEEEEGNFALWLSYIFTGAGANIVSWLVLPRNAVSIGASGAVFGLFAISILVKMSWDWRKILEVLILGQFVIEKVMEAAQASTGLSGSSYSLRSVNHIAHLSGALIGVLLVWLLSKIPSQSLDKEISNLNRKRD